MRKISVPDKVSDNAVGSYEHPLDIAINDDGALRIMKPKDAETCWAYLYPEQVLALYGGLRAHFEGDDGKDT